jgi:hypothetical protein
MLTRLLEDSADVPIGVDTCVSVVVGSGWGTLPVIIFSLAVKILRNI